MTDFSPGFSKLIDFGVIGAILVIIVIAIWKISSSISEWSKPRLDQLINSHTAHVKQLTKDVTTLAASMDKMANDWHKFVELMQHQAEAQNRSELSIEANSKKLDLLIADKSIKEVET